MYLVINKGPPSTMPFASRLGIVSKVQLRPPYQHVVTRST